MMAKSKDMIIQDGATTGSFYRAPGGQLSAARLVGATISVGNNTDFSHSAIRGKSCMICATRIPF
jgi:hypothetical protein